MSDARRPVHDEIFALSLEANCSVEGPNNEVADAEGQIICRAATRQMGKLICQLIDDAIASEEQTRTRE